jgi:hypothetical protein
MEVKTTEQIKKEREKVLTESRVLTDKANELYARFKEWQKEAEAAFPAPWCFGDKRQQKKHKTLSALVDRIFGGTYVYRRNVERFAEEDRRAIEKAKKDMYAEEVSARALKREEELTRLQTAAVKWLLERGLVLGADFDVGNALDIANDKAAEEWKAAVEVRWHSFGGDDNCENCSGWDGVSHRCDCGNRRVYWERDESHTFEKPSFNATAY